MNMLLEKAKKWVDSPKYAKTVITIEIAILVPLIIRFVIIHF